MVSSDVITLVVCLVGFVIIGLTVKKLVMPAEPSKAEKLRKKKDEEAASVVAGEAAAAGGLGRMKGAARKAAKKQGGMAALRQRQVKKREEEEARRQAEMEADDDGEISLENEDGSLKTKKQLLREQKKRDRAEERRFEQAQRESRAEKQEKKSAKQLAYEQKEQERADKEMAALEEARRQAEEKKKKDQEEYDQWKDMFSVDEQGNSGDSGPAESQGLLYEFMDDVTERKLVVLEELAVRFKLAADECIDRVKTLDAAGRLSGLIDDRGKFIHITEPEMKSVVDFIQRRGRVSVADLVRESSALVRVEALIPDAKTFDDEDEEDEKKEGSGDTAAAAAEEPQAPAREYKILDDEQVKIQVVRRGKAKKEKQAQRVSALEFTRT